MREAADQRVIVGGNDNGGTQLIEFLEEIHEPQADHVVDIARGFVGQQQIGPRDNGAGDGDDLLDGGAVADELFGSAGFDLASYRGSKAGVQVLLYAGSGLFGDAAGILLISFNCRY